MRDTHRRRMGVISVALSQMIQFFLLRTCLEATKALRLIKLISALFGTISLKVNEVIVNFGEK